MVEFHKSGIIVTENEFMLAWEDIALVVVRTTDQGPSDDDVFWEFYSLEDAGHGTPTLRFSQSCTAGEELLDIVPKMLEGFDYQKVIDAMCSAQNAQFVVFRRPDVRRYNDVLFLL